MKKIIALIIMAVPCILRSYTQEISAGSNHSFIVCKGNKDENGDVYSWGFNNYGQLGHGNNMGVLTPSQVNINGVQKIDAGAMHTLFLKSDGTVWSTGENQMGQLGKGDTVDANSTVQISGISGVRSISAGWEHSVALKNDSTVWCWGYNQYGQLGLGDTINRNIPVMIPGLNRVTAIATGRHHTLAIKHDGTVWAWGWNPLGQLGNNSTQNSLVPVQVIGLTGIIAVAGGDWHSLALKNNGTVWSWGSNTYGQLGLGTNSWSDSVAAMIPSFSSVTKIDAGRFHSIALKNNGTLFSWGINAYGVLGNGTTADENIPVQVPGLNNVIRIAAGGEHNLALKNNGTLWAWGLNGNGQLGDGNFATQSESPVSVASPCATTTLGYDNTTEGNFSFFPNPAVNILFIQADLPGADRIKIYDLLGKIVLDQPLEQGITGIDVSRLANGMYLVNIGAKSKKIMIGK